MGRQATIWTPERKAELKRHWEAGTPHSELSKLFPGYSARSLANQALRVGAFRPEKQDAARARILLHLRAHPNQTVVDVTRAMPFSADHVRGVMRALHSDRQIRIVDYGAGGSHVYACGEGGDLTRDEWRAAKKAVKVASSKRVRRKRVVSFNEARVIYSVATPGAFPVQRDYTVTALFGSP